MESEIEYMYAVCYFDPFVDSSDKTTTMAILKMLPKPPSEDLRA